MPDLEVPGALKVGRIGRVDVENAVLAEGTSQEEAHMAYQDTHRNGILEVLVGRNVDLVGEGTGMASVAAGSLEDVGDVAAVDYTVVVAGAVGLAPVVEKGRNWDVGGYETVRLKKRFL